MQDRLIRNGQVAEAAERSCDDGDRAARRALIEACLITNRASYIGYLRRRLNNPADVEDIYQDFCLRALAKADQLRDEDAVHGWLKRLLFSVLQDHYRARHTTRRGLGALAEAEAVAAQGSPEDTARTPEPQVCTCVYEHLPHLKPDYRTVLWEVDFRGQPRETVAAALKLSAGAMRVRLHRARRALRETLRKGCPKCLDGSVEGCHFSQDPCNA